jgi:LAS superfamily LD-carboxypeptidase LdcB
VACYGSEHLTGRAIDFNLGPPNTSEAVMQGQFNNEAYRWLEQNAGNYGFNPYDAEPWHWSYNVR